MVLFTASVSYATPENKSQVRSEVCTNMQATVAPEINFESTVASCDVTGYSFEIEIVKTPQVPQINDRGNIDRWCKQERIRLCNGFINSSSNPPNLIL